MGDVFGSPLAIEGIGAFMLEATFIGLWVFGWDRLSPRVHLATIYLVWIGTWLSAYFILTANSWMQHPVGYEINEQTGRTEATDIVEILFQGFVLFAWAHVVLAGLVTATFFVLGVSCWHLLRGRNVDVFRGAAKLAIVVALPVTFVQLGVGSEFGVAVTDAQPMKIAATRGALGHRAAGRVLALPDRGLHARTTRRRRSTSRSPACSRSSPPTRSTARLSGSTNCRASTSRSSDRATTCRTSDSCTGACASWRTSATLLFLLALWGAWLLPAHEAHDATWFQRSAIVAIAFPFLSNFAGWILTEAGRQPWVVYGLLQDRGRGLGEA